MARKMTDTEIDRAKVICELAGVKEIDDLSDGFHTFRQLYYQRMMLFATIVKQNRDKAWKSLRHEDGELCFGGGWFIVGIDTPEGSYTYHYEDYYYSMFDCEELRYGKHWDGHTEKDITRLLSLPSVQPDHTADINKKISISYGHENDLISRQAAIDELVRWGAIPEYNEAEKNILACCIGMLSTLPSVQPQRKTDEWCSDCKEYDNEKHCCPRFNRVIRQTLSEQTEWNNHTVACLLAELFGDACACNFNGINEWLPEKCEVIDACPNPVGVACWEQFLKHRAERRTDE